ncbi:MAG: PEP-CTERM sorting domain-containing protein [Phycisphaerae bacterium]|nr:PEP-CTERM sorting domain-containing protein [Phycisphaerae bacterium]
MKKLTSMTFCLVAVVGILMSARIAPAAIMTFNSNTPANNSATRSNWLTAAGIVAPEYLVDFESGFVDNQDISGVGGLFPANLIITDTGASNDAIIRSGAGIINGSNPVGTFSVTQDELAFLELDFSANPVDYVGFQDIDHAETTGIVTFVGGGTANISFETTGVGGDSAEFFGIFRNDMPQITLVQLDASGDGRWGIDTIEYSPEPATLALLLIGGLALLRSRR